MEIYRGEPECGGGLPLARHELPEGLDGIGTPQIFRFLERRRVIVDVCFRVRVGSVREEQLYRFRIVQGGRVVEGRVVVDSALLNIRAEGDKKPDDIALVRAAGGKRGDQRREASAILVIRVGSEIEKRSDERELAVVNRVL